MLSVPKRSEPSKKFSPPRNVPEKDENSNELQGLA
jgi:hypothetical protein